MTKCRRSSHGQFQTLLHFGQGNWFLALEDFLFGENPSCLFTTPIWPLTTSEKWLPSSMLSSCDRLAWSPAVNEWKKCFIMKFAKRKKMCTFNLCMDNWKYQICGICNRVQSRFEFQVGYRAIKPKYTEVQQILFKFWIMSHLLIRYYKKVH